MLSPLLLTPRARAQVPAWNDDLYVHIFALSLSAALAQIFILITIRDYGAPSCTRTGARPVCFLGVASDNSVGRAGALLFATVMTTRQFLSILLSCLLFLHPLSLGQVP
jgi:hypothetical protein